MNHECTYFLGIDPGLQGAIALFEPTSSLAFIYDMPKAKQGGVSAPALHQIVSTVVARTLEHDPGAKFEAAVENVHSLPRQAGVFAFGLSTGMIHGVLAANGIPFTLISPSQWKPAMGLGRKHDETIPENKTRARAVASHLFPSLADQFTRVKDDGRAEALLLAVYHANRMKVAK